MYGNIASSSTDKTGVMLEQLTYYAQELPTVLGRPAESVQRICEIGFAGKQQTFFGKTSSTAEMDRWSILRVKTRMFFLRLATRTISSAPDYLIGCLRRKIFLHVGFF